MKRKITSLLVVTLIVALTTLNSCKKEEDYDAKYQAKGNYGNTNITTKMFTVITWTNNGFNWYADLSVPELTSSVQDNGTVDVFCSSDNGTSWIALPFTKFVSSYYQMSYLTTINTVQILWTYYGSGQGSNPSTVFGTTIKIKVVITTPVA